MIRKSISANDSHSKSGSLKIKMILKQEPDFNRALDLVVRFLVVYEPFRLKRKDILSISEILALKSYHRSVWGADYEL
jgi:hypothetical protein